MITNGTRVRTADKLEPRDYTLEGQAERKPGSYGTVIRHSDCHGLCFEVRHDDGRSGYYDPDELTELDLVAQTIAKLTSMSDDDRSRVFAAFCLECGAPKSQVRPGGLRCCYPDPEWNE
jgi:hypothetical protein